MDALFNTSGMAAVFLIILAILWFLLPFAVFGIKSKIDQTLKVQNKMLELQNEMLESLKRLETLAVKMTGEVLTDESSMEEVQLSLIKSEILSAVKFDDCQTVRPAILTKHGITEQRYENICKDLLDAGKITRFRFNKLIKK